MAPERRERYRDAASSAERLSRLNNGASEGYNPFIRATAAAD